MAYKTKSEKRAWRKGRIKGEWIDGKFIPD